VNAPLRKSDTCFANEFDQLDGDYVCFMPNGLFEFARDMRNPCGAKAAAIIPCRDEFGNPLDLAAWHLPTGTLATLHGAAAMLGEDQINAPQIDCDGLRVFPSPAEWLRARRAGVVIVDAKRARWRLADRRLVVADASFGRRLRAMLRLPEPRVFVESVRESAA